MKVKTTDKPISVTVNIKLGLTTVAASQQWRRFWTKIISVPKDEVKGEQPQSQKPEDAVWRQDDEDKEVTDAD